MPWGRNESVLLTASSFDSMKAGLTRRECERRRSQTLMMLSMERISEDFSKELWLVSPVRGAR